MSKPKLMIPNNFVYIWTNLERKILDKILYGVDNSAKTSENYEHSEVPATLSGVLESKTSN
jgi:hypothetical protein